MRAIGGWANSLLRFLANLVFGLLVILPAYIVVGVLWLVYVIGIAGAFSLLIGWLLYEATSSMLLSITAALLGLAIYWHAIWYVNQKTDWPFQSGERMFRSFLMSLPDFD